MRRVEASRPWESGSSAWSAGCSRGVAQEWKEVTNLKGDAHVPKLLQFCLLCCAPPPPPRPVIRASMHISSPSRIAYTVYLDQGGKSRPGSALDMGVSLM